MDIQITCPRRYVKGYDDLVAVNHREFNGNHCVMTHFTFNLASVSFNLLVMPDRDQVQDFMLANQPFLLIKMRCDNPIVEFYGLGRCLPVVQAIRIFAEAGFVKVEMDSYATIQCRRVHAQTEEVDPATVDPIVWH